MDIEENLVKMTKSIPMIECGFNALRICIFLWWIIWKLENIGKIERRATNKCYLSRKRSQRLKKYRKEIQCVQFKLYFCKEMWESCQMFNKYSTTKVNNQMFTKYSTTEVTKIRCSPNTAQQRWKMNYLN